MNILYRDYLVIICPYSLMRANILLRVAGHSLWRVGSSRHGWVYRDALKLWQMPIVIQTYALGDGVEAFFRV